MAGLPFATTYYEQQSKGAINQYAGNLDNSIKAAEVSSCGELIKFPPAIVSTRNTFRERLLCLNDLLSSTINDVEDMLEGLYDIDKENGD